MKRNLEVMLFLILFYGAGATRLAGQELPSKPLPRLEQEEVGSRSLPAGKLISGALPSAPPPQEMVWGGIQADQLLPVNSCAWCGRPMSFRQAAFDKKALAMWGAAVALAVADTETGLRNQCVRDGRCRELNPLLGNSRGQQYGVRLPVLALAWMGTAYLRKGDRAKNVGGLRHWWLLALPYQALPAVGIGRNVTRE